MKKFDVIIIGAGSAGLSALREVRKYTDNFVLINGGPWGTTCARVGCMPSKVLIEAANAFHRRHKFEEFGIFGAEHLKVDCKLVLQRVRKLRDFFVASTLKSTEELGDRAISGYASLVSPNEVTVNGQMLSASKIIIATGSHPIVPDNWGNLGNYLLTTDTLFEQKTLPERIAVIGMGPVGLEMAQALSRLGIEVSGFSANPMIGGLSDATVNQIATELIFDEFQLYLGDQAEVEVIPSKAAVKVQAGAIGIEVNAVLAALGRRPNIDHIGLEKLDVPLDDQGLPVFDPTTLQVGNLPVYLAGDANQQLPLLHEAADEGHIAGLSAVREEPICFKRRTPMAIVFTDPNIAIVGRTFRTLDPNEIRIGEVSFDNQGRARSAQKNRGILRVYAEVNSGKLLGAEMCAPAGEHFAHLLALAIDQSLSVWDVLRMPFYHPVLEEGLRTALRDLASKLPTCSGSDLAACEPFGCEALD